MIYIGMDVHKDSCYITVIDAEGKTIDEKEIKTEDIDNWIKTLDKESKIAMESSTASKPLYHVIKEQGF